MVYHTAPETVEIAYSVGGAVRPKRSDELGIASAQCRFLAILSVRRARLEPSPRHSALVQLQLRAALACSARHAVAPTCALARGGAAARSRHGGAGAASRRRHGAPRSGALVLPPAMPREPPGRTRSQCARVPGRDMAPRASPPCAACRRSSSASARAPRPTSSKPSPSASSTSPPGSSRPAPPPAASARRRRGRAPARRSARRGRRRLGAAALASRRA